VYLVAIHIALTHLANTLGTPTGPCTATPALGHVQFQKPPVRGKVSIFCVAVWTLANPDFSCGMPKSHEQNAWRSELYDCLIRFDSAPASKPTRIVLIQKWQGVKALIKPCGVVYLELPAKAA